MQIDRENDENQLNDTCTILSAGSFSLIVDLSWGGWQELRDKAKASGFPYIRLDAANHQFVQVLVMIFVMMATLASHGSPCYLLQAADDYLRDREAMDAALLFETESQLDQSLYFLIGHSVIRVIVMELGEDGVMARLAKLRPAPSYYVVHGDTPTIMAFYE